MGIGRTLITLGIALVVIGIFLSYGSRLPFRLGRLPGDVYIRGKNTTFYFPLATCIVLSLAFSLLMWVLRRFR